MVISARRREGYSIFAFSYGPQEPLIQSQDMKRVIRVIGIAIAILVVLALVLPLFVNADQFRPLLQTKLSAALGREVTLGGLKLSIFSGSVTASDLSIADDPAFSKSPFLRASTLEAGIELMPLILSRKLNVTGISIDQPQVDLVQNAAGVWNFSSIGAAPSSAAARPLARRRRVRRPIWRFSRSRSRMGGLLWRRLGRRRLL